MGYEQKLVLLGWSTHSINFLGTAHFPHGVQKMDQGLIRAFSDFHISSLEFVSVTLFHLAP